MALRFWLAVSRLGSFIVNGAAEMHVLLHTVGRNLEVLGNERWGRRLARMREKS
jgi:hypothetical protein